MGWWTKLWTKTAESMLYCELLPENIPAGVNIDELESGKGYVSMSLTTMQIKNFRKGLSTFYPAVHSYISVGHRGGTPALFNVLTTPNDLQELDAANLNRVVVKNIPLLGPIPYRGGKVNVETGLFSIKSADLAKPYLSLLADMSTKAGISFISQALPFADLIKNGINMLVGGASDMQLEIGLSTTYDKIKTGYYVILAAPEKSVKKTDLRLIDGTLCFKDGSTIDEYAYMVFQIQSMKNRADWFNIPEIIDSYKKLQNAQREMNRNQIKDRLQALKVVLYTSDDLLLADAEKIYAEIEAEVTALFPATTISVTKAAKELKELDKYNVFG